MPASPSNITRESRERVRGGAGQVRGELQREEVRDQEQEAAAHGVHAARRHQDTLRKTIGNIFGVRV